MVSAAAQPRRGISILPRPRRPTYWQRDQASGYAFVGPQVGGFLVFVLGPIVAVGWFALHEWNLIFGAPRFVGLANLQRLIVDQDIPQVTLSSVLFALGYVPLNVGLGLAFAMAINR